MRITSQIIERRSLETIQKNLASLDEAQLRATTGLRIHNASDDPAGFVGVLSADRRIASLEQYRRNIGSAQARLGAEEAVLDQLGDILARARELATSQAGANGSASTRLVTKAEVDQLLAGAIALGNTPWGNGYLFGGDFENVKPFAADGSSSVSTPPTGGRSVEYSEGQTLPVNHAGLDVFVNTGAFASIERLSNALANNDDAEILASLSDLSSSFDAVQNLLGEVGARGRQFDMATANIDGLVVSLRSVRSDLSEADMEEAVTQLVSRQTAYQAALLATSRMLSNTLTDYLR